MHPLASDQTVRLIIEERQREADRWRATTVKARSGRVRRRVGKWLVTVGTRLGGSGEPKPDVVGSAAGAALPPRHVPERLRVG